MQLRPHFIAALIATGIANAAVAATIEIGSASGPRGGEVEIDVVLHTEGDEVVGTENVIVFPSDLDPLECRVNLEINRFASAFVKYPAGRRYEGRASLKALIFDFLDLSPLEDGVTLYSCRIQIAPDAEVGNHELECVDPGAATPDGAPVETSCRNGLVRVTGAPAVPTRVTIPTPTLIPSPTQVPFPPTTYRYPPPEEEHFLFLETSLIEVSAERGGQVVILGGMLDTYADHSFESRFGPVGWVDVHLDRTPDVGIPFDFDTSTTPGESPYGDYRVGGFGAILSIRPGSTYIGEVAITAEAGPRRASTSIWIVPGDQERRVWSVAVSVDENSIEERSGGQVGVTAQVFGSDGEPVNGVPVLFRSEAGFFEPNVAMAEFDGQRDGIVRSTLVTREDTVALVDPWTGSFVPYTIEAQSGFETGYSRVWVVPSGAANDSGVDGSPAGGVSSEDDGCAVVSPTDDGPALAWLAFLLLPWLGARRLRRAPARTRRRSLRR